MLEQIQTPQDLKKLNIKELTLLCDEIREKIINVVEKNGGHLSANLGTVELIVALYYVFDFPKDKIVFDVGHQAYTHKILSERSQIFETIRKIGGLSGFPNIFESKYDSYCAGHAGSAISAGLGYCYSRDALGQDYYVICFVGDGALINGVTLEALTSSEYKPDKFLIILNDNGMSINKNDSGLYKIITKLSRSKTYSKTMKKANNKIGNNALGRFLKRIKSFVKRLLSPFAVLEHVGLRYIGVYDGNNLKQNIKLLKDIRETQRVNFLHVKTLKGKGSQMAEEKPDIYHGIGSHFKTSLNSFSKSFGEKITEIAKDKNLVTITAGMKDGVGLTEFADKHPKKFIDVGIAEEHAVTLSAGIALGGIKPYVAIYSTFMQRVYDQVLIDVCMQNLPVVFCIDRAGFVGSDGQTHQGLFDISYLSSMPNLTILAPKDTVEFKEMLEFSYNYDKPLAIRYCNGLIQDFEEHKPFDLTWENVYFQENNKITIIAVGNRMITIASDFIQEESGVNLINARVVKPLDENCLQSINSEYIITMEENAIIGGFGQMVQSYYADRGIDKKIIKLGAKDKFVPHGTIEYQLELNGITINELKRLKKEIYE